MSFSVFSLEVANILRVISHKSITGASLDYNKRVERESFRQHLSVKIQVFSMFFDENDDSGASQLYFAVRILWVTLALTIVNIVLSPEHISAITSNYLLALFFVGFFILNIGLIHNIAQRQKWALYMFSFFFVLGAPSYIKAILLLSHEISVTVFLNVIIAVLQLIAILLLIAPPGSHQFGVEEDISALSGKTDGKVE